MTSCADILKQDFSITESLSDLKFTGYTKKPYQNEAKEAVFGEKLCILYSVEFTAYNVRYSLKILAFAYVRDRYGLVNFEEAVVPLFFLGEYHFNCSASLKIAKYPLFIHEKFHEVLKLDIAIHDGKLEKELAPCRNFLQRHRNLNATFRTLIQFSKFIESRRLIIAIVLSKQEKIALFTNEESSLQVKYFSDLSKILIKVSWKVEWDIKECEFLDLIEVYYNNFVLPTTDVIRETLTALTHHSLDFHTKYKLWTLLMTTLNKSEEHVGQIQKEIERTSHNTLSETESVLVISDSEEDSGTFPTDRKKRRVEPPQSYESCVILVPD